MLHCYYQQVVNYSAARAYNHLRLVAQLSLYIGYRAPFHTPRLVLVALVFSLLNALTYNTFRLLSSGKAAGGWGINFYTAIIPNLNKPEEGPVSSATEILITTSPNVARK